MTTPTASGTHPIHPAPHPAGLFAGRPTEKPVTQGVVLRWPSGLALHVLVTLYGRTIATWCIPADDGGDELPTGTIRAAEC